MKKAIIVEFKNNQNETMLMIKEEISNFLLRRKSLVKVLDYAHIYDTKECDDGRYHYRGDVILLEGSSLIIAAIDAIWGNRKMTKPFDDVCVNYNENKIKFKKSS